MESLMIVAKIWLTKKWKSAFFQTRRFITRASGKKDGGLDCERTWVSEIEIPDFWEKLQASLNGLKLENRVGMSDRWSLEAEQINGSPGPPPLRPCFKLCI